MKQPGLDATDIRILSAVQQHGQLRKTRLAELVNLSPTPCRACPEGLTAEGEVHRYHVELTLERTVNLTQVVVNVSLCSHRKADFGRIEDTIRKLDEVTDCIATGSGMDDVTCGSSGTEGGDAGGRSRD